MPDDFERLKIEEESASADGADDDKKRQKRGGKGLLRVKKKEDVPKKICVSRAARGKKKSVTVVTGLSTFGELWRRVVQIPKIQDSFHPDSPCPYLGNENVPSHCYIFILFYCCA